MSLVISLFSLQSCRSLQEYSDLAGYRAAHILAVGTARNRINEYYIVLDGELVPCKAKSSRQSLMNFSKAHYLFGISCDQALTSISLFVQTTIYNIDVGLSHETPRVKDLRAKLLN